MPYSVPDPYTKIIRTGSYGLSYVVDASRAGVAIQGAQGMRPIGGSITDTSKPGVRRVLNLELSSEPGMFDLLSPEGTTLTVTAKITYPNRTVVSIPMGVFDVDVQDADESEGRLSLTAPDKWSRIQRSKFIGPFSYGYSVLGNPVVNVIQQLIQDALGAGEPVTNLATSTAQTGWNTWEKDRDKAIIELANGIGAWVYFDRLGVATIADVPLTGPSAHWLIDASPSGVLLDLNRKRDRAETFNVVVLESSSTAVTDPPTFKSAVWWDDDSQSPTYAGTDPLTNPSSAGPFGINVKYESTSLPLLQGDANTTAKAMLYRSKGLVSQTTVTTAPNPAADALDIIDVLPRKERYDIPRVLERQIIDHLAHPLTLQGELSILGRSIGAVL